jgi:hypothetical protein
MSIQLSAEAGGSGLGESQDQRIVLLFLYRLGPASLQDLLLRRPGPTQQGLQFRRFEPATLAPVEGHVFYKRLHLCSDAFGLLASLDLHRRSLLMTTRFRFLGHNLTPDLLVQSDIGNARRVYDRRLKLAKIERVSSSGGACAGPER